MTLSQAINSAAAGGGLGNLQIGRCLQGGVTSGPLSAPALVRTSGPTTVPMTADIYRPFDWNSAVGTITLVVQRATSTAVDGNGEFTTGKLEATATMVGATTSYPSLFSGDVRSPQYAHAAAYVGAVRPAALNWSPIIGAGDTVAPTITSSASITLSSGVAGTLALTANEFVTWAITGGVNSDQFTLSGSTLTALAQTASGSNSVQVTATDPCGNATTQTITATLTLAEFSSASTDKYGSIVLAGTPKLVATGGAGVGSAQNVRLTVDPAADKVVWQITPTSYVAGDSLYIGAEDTTANFTTAGQIMGLSNSKAVTLGFGDWGWEIYHTSGNPQANYGQPHVAGDAYMYEYQISTGTHAFYRVRSGVKSQLGTTITGLSSTFKRGFAGMKNGTQITASLNSFAAAATAGYSNYA